MLQLQELAVSGRNGNSEVPEYFFTPQYPLVISTRTFYGTHSSKKRMKDKLLAQLENDDITIIIYQVN